MSVSSVFGQVITGDVVRLGVVAHLQRWMPTYIAEIARQRGVPTPAPIRSWAARVDFNELPGDAMPVIIVVTPGLTDRPRRLANGTYEVDWAVGIGVIASASTEEDTMRLAELYTAAARVSMLQHGSISGLAIGTSWEDERYDDKAGLPIRPDDTRTIAAGQAMFILTITDVVSAYGGPADPPVNVDTPPTPWPTVEQVIVSISKETI